MSDETCTVPRGESNDARARQLPSVLVVEDDSSVAEGIRLLLEPQYRVQVVSSGEEALQRLAQAHSFEVVLCDLMMPKVSGIELYRSLSNSSPDTARRMIFMTGGAYTEEADDFLRSVSNVRVQKPFNLRNLHRQLQNVIASSRS